MGFYYAAMLLTVISNAAYHICQRSISARISPLVSLGVTYGVAFTATILALLFLGGGAGQGSLTSQLRSVNWASYALGVAAVGLELGFLFVYRAGWKVSIAALVSNAAVTLALIPIGVFFFGENLGVKKLAGIAFAGFGLWLLSV